jgi:uncharacterized protein involved in exopolysaccharide biosynthesis
LVVGCLFRGLAVRRSYLETFFRHPLLLSLPLVLALGAALAYGFTTPRTYLATATVWADTRVPADSTIGTSSGGNDAPSTGQQALLTELLATRAFRAAVANDSRGKADLAKASSAPADEDLARLTAAVTATTAGPHVVRVDVKEQSPAAAIGVASAVAQRFLVAEAAQLQARAQEQSRYDKLQLDAAAKNLAHSNSGSVTPAGEAALAQQYSDAAKAYGKSSAAVTQQDSSALSILDKPVRAEPQSRKKPLLFSAVGGLLAGGTISVCALLMLVARDTSAREAADVEGALGLTVAGTVVELPRARRQIASSPDHQPAAVPGAQ